MPESNPKVLVISSIPPRKPTDKPGEAWADLAEITCATHRKYCDRWGYDYHLDVSDLYERINPTKRGEPKGDSVPIYYKIKFLLFQHFLDPDSCHREYDWVVWVDSDLLFTNYEIPLSEFFNGKNAVDGIGDGSGFNGDIVYSYDPNGLHATVIMLRRSEQTLGYVFANADAGFRYFGQDFWADQLSSRFFLGTPPYSLLARFFSIKQLCPMPPGVYTHIPNRARVMYEWAPGDLSLHLSALPLATRVSMAKHWVEEYHLL